MKKILGLDLGTNSIGWALINLDFENEKGNIIDVGSRIIPMDADLVKNFEVGNSISKTANRRAARGARRLRFRYKLRRERLIKTLKIVGWLSHGFPEKFDGLARHNINDFLPFSKATVHECAEFLNTNPDSIPHDWVIYFLRKKGLTERIEIQELARILYHFNQRRGFKSNRKGNDGSTIDVEDMETGKEKAQNETRVEIVKVISVFDTGEITRGKKVFQIGVENELADGLFTGTLLRANAPEWEGTEQELEIRIKRSQQGTRIELTLPDKSEWKKSKEALEKEILNSRLHPGEYFLNQIKKDPNFRIRQRVLDRMLFYRELEAIWDCQKKFHPELIDHGNKGNIAIALYRHNKQKQKEIISNDLMHIILNDIIYYQRPLKSQKSSIGNCRFEKKNITLKYKNDHDYIPYLKAAPVSSPIFQIFRIWKTIHNIRVIALQKIINGKLQTDVDVTEEHLDYLKKAELFREFDEREQIKVSYILTKFLKLSPTQFKLNYPDDTVFPGNQTKHFFKKAFNRLEYHQGEILLSDFNSLNHLWHLFYSVEESNAIANSLIKHYAIPDEIANKLSTLPPFPPRYAAYSQKALNKLIQVMCCGEYWSYEKIGQKTRERIQKLIDAEDDPDVNEQTRLMLRNLKSEEQYQGLPEYLATYVVYGKHSEREGEPVEKPDAIKFPLQKSLRNPIVEQVLNETLQLTKAIWVKYGRPDEIRVEMTRDMNRTAKEREKLSKIRDKNRDEKIRIKAILQELKLGNPDSPSDIEKLRLLEENGNYDRFNYTEKFFRKVTEPTKSEIDKYRLWVEQNCVSPYTGKPIMLSRLFTRDYDVEHIIPRSKYFDDSLGNKVIVETWANDEKGSKTALQYIRNGSSVGRLLALEDYIAHVNKTFTRKKRAFLLKDEIPKGFIERQKNDVRYIARQVNLYLSQIVENDKIRVSMGEVTNELKIKWGLNEMMKKLLIPRFERLEKITGDKLITRETTDQGQRKIHLDGYEKRIDHRHHALDALITACTTNSHVQYLNTLSGQNDPSVKYKFRKLLNSDKTRDFRLPWNTFIPDAYKAIEGIIVSHKNRNRILSKGFNNYFRYVMEDGKWTKKPVAQKKENLFSIRKALHKETIAGTIKLRRYKSVNLGEAIEKIDYVADNRVKNALRKLIQETGGDIRKIKKEIAENPLVDKNNNPVSGKIQIWYFEKFAVSREKLNDSFNEKKIREKVAEYDTQTGKGLKQMLLDHLKGYDGDAKAAFTGEGLEELWKKSKHPITTVSTYEPIGNKFQIRPNQWVEAATGTNLFFVIYENIETGERDYETLGFNEVVAAKTNKLPVVKAREGYRHFTISPNDLVYFPEENENIILIDWDKDKERVAKRIYKMISSTGKQCFFIPHNILKPIIERVEFGSLNKAEKSVDNIMIKASCIKIKHDIIGGISPI